MNQIQKSVSILLALLVFFCTVGFGLSKTQSVHTYQEPSIPLPIVMYHSILKDPNQLGEFVISPTQLEEDLKLISQAGYTTVVVQDLVDYVYKDKPLPEKPIMLTFDDGYYNNFVYALPLLKKFQMKAVMAVVGAYTEKSSITNECNANYSYVTWGNIYEMMFSGVFEIQNHSYGLHNLSGRRKGCKKVPFESLAQYQQVVTTDIGKLQNVLLSYTGKMPLAFVYPFGIISPESLDVIRSMGFLSSFSCYKGVSRISKNPNSLYVLKRNLRTTHVSSASFLNSLFK